MLNNLTNAPLNNLIRCLCFFGLIQTGPFLISKSWSKPDKLQVLIDPGHGGEDYGGVSSRLSEEFVVFDVSKKLMNELNKLNISSAITRTKNQTLSLQERVQMAIAKQPLVFISIHANIHADPQIRGAEFYIEPSNALLGHTDFLTFLSADADLKALSPTEHPRFYYPNVKKLGIRSPANIIILDMLRMKTRRQSLDLAENLKQFWSSKKSEIREGQFYILKQLPIASSLVELGYLSNPEDFRILNSAEKRQQLAKNLALGLQQYFKDKD
jgi:N-acetylmuramoyl-L-alanine amidase